MAAWRAAVASGVGLEVSTAEFEALGQQQVDAVHFFRPHTPALQHMRRIQGVERASLDFGIAMRDVAIQSDIFSADLLACLAAAGCDLEVTQFLVRQNSRNHRRFREIHRRAS